MAKIARYNQRMLDVQEALKLQGIEMKNDFLESINFHPFNMDKIKKGTLSFTADQIQLCIDKYKVNPAFFFHPKAKMFL